MPQTVAKSKTQSVAKSTTQSVAKSTTQSDPWVDPLGRVVAGSGPGSDPGRPIRSPSNDCEEVPINRYLDFSFVLSVCKHISFQKANDTLVGVAVGVLVTTHLKMD